MLTRWLRRRCIQADPAAAEARRERKTANRGVGVEARADGLALL
ncbi:MAG: hypothetical protein ABWZ26_04425 [Candidatus Nanopelagicales bacterium]